MNNINRYVSGDYTKKNQSYHSEDSKFKWKNFYKILKRSNLNLKELKSITDIGCGGGQILIHAKNSNLFNSQCIFEGYDINPDAIDIAKKKSNDVDFFNKDFIKLDVNKKDLIISADVFEHVQDTYDFLTKLVEKGNYFIFNIPLEISLLSMIRKKNIFEHSYKNVGHLHFYSKRTALLTLVNSGFKILNYNLVNNRFEEFKNNKKILSLLINIPQYIFEKLNINMSCSIFGGYSLVVLAKKS
tara:strand:+ start:436 stop:1164 length:729 start_codon:yes stop_codon:yes gene_type:complete